METNKGQLEVFNYLSKGNQFVLYIFRRISKVSQATYIITDIIKDIEPLKWTLRKVSAEMASLKYFLDEQNVFNNLERMLLELEGLLEFARHTKVLSPMNVEMLQAEIKRLVAEMKESSQSPIYSAKLGQGFFDVAKPVPHKGHNVLYDFYVKDALKTNNTQKPQHAIPKEQGERREEVLKIIRNKGAVTIKDITEQVQNCSEKTIQRELTVMVVLGIIKKTGERRWSRYSVS